MLLPDEIFKAYDIRGIVDKSLTTDGVREIGKALGSEAMEKSVTAVVIGWDGRLTGPGLATALSEGFLSTGCHVIEIGQVPTPVLYYATVKFGTGSGVQVTGSHNPPEYNGLKMMIGGTTLSGDAIQAIKQRARSGNFQSGQGNINRREILGKYHQAVINDVSLEKSLKVVIDCGNGVAGAVAPQVFRDLGCEVIELFCEVDGNFPNHHPDPSQLQNLQDLIRAVAEHNADFGMAFDGDGDRLGIVSSSGEVIWPDRQMALFSRAILEQNPGAEIIFDVKCSQVLPKIIKDAGGVATMWKTGHSFMKSKLKESGAVLAGEMSGHIFFNDRWGGFDDGIYTGARLCELLSRTDKSLDQVFAEIPNTVNTPELRLEMEEGEHYQLVEKLVACAKFDDAVVTTIDGVRVDFEEGFGLIRASNTTPTVIFRFEAATESQMENIQERFRALILGVDSSLELPF
jgi:phosphomannomutase/phosphoglucomutase